MPSTPPTQPVPEVQTTTQTVPGKTQPVRVSGAYSGDEVTERSACAQSAEINTQTAHSLTKSGSSSSTTQIKTPSLLALPQSLVKGSKTEVRSSETERRSLLTSTQQLTNGAQTKPTSAGASTHKATQGKQSGQFGIKRSQASIRAEKERIIAEKRKAALERLRLSKQSQQGSQPS